MNHPGTSSVHRRGARSISFKSAAIALLFLLNLALVASAPKKSGVTAYVYGKYLEKPEPCPGEERNIIFSAFGEVLNEDGTVVDSWPIPGMEIDISEPKLGVFTTKETMQEGGPNGSVMVTNENGIAYARYKAKETGKETLQITYTGYDYRTQQILGQKTSLSFRVWNCLVAPIINLFAKADLPAGSSITNWGVGGGEARIKNDGQISGDGEISMTEAMVLPQPYCTTAESSGQASFTIQGHRDDQTINLKFDFNDLTIPPATSTCTAGGVSVSYPAVGGESGDPAIATGFHELSVPAGGGTTSFPYPMAEFSGGTTVVVTLMREESTASEFNPFTAIGALPIWSLR